jgi:hypothetical protein
VFVVWQQYGSWHGWYRRASARFGRLRRAGGHTREVPEETWEEGRFGRREQDLGRAAGSVRVGHATLLDTLVTQ